MRDKVGVVHGRFQPFHNHHLRYCQAALELCEHLVVGITNPDDSTTAHDATDARRSLRESNPLTYYERMVIVREGLVSSGLQLSQFAIVPFPINFPVLLRQYAPRDATYYMTIYDDWGRRKHQVLTDLGLRVDVLWDKDISEKGIVGTDLRERIADGLEWEHLVPSGSLRAIHSLGLVEQLRSSGVSSRRSN